MSFFKKSQHDAEEGRNHQFAFQFSPVVESPGYRNPLRTARVRRRRAVQRVFWRRQQRHLGGAVKVIKRILSLAVVSIIALPLMLVSLVAILAMRASEIRHGKQTDI